MHGEKSAQSWAQLTHLCVLEFQARTAPAPSWSSQNIWSKRNYVVCGKRYVTTPLYHTVYWVYCVAGTSDGRHEPNERGHGRRHGRRGEPVLRRARRRRDAAAEGTQRLHDQPTSRAIRWRWRSWRGPSRWPGRRPGRRPRGGARRRPGGLHQRGWHGAPSTTPGAVPSSAPVRGARWRPAGSPVGYAEQLQPRSQRRWHPADRRPGEAQADPAAVGTPAPRA